MANTVKRGTEITWTTPSGETRQGEVLCNAPAPRHWKPPHFGEITQTPLARAVWVIPAERKGGEGAACYVRWTVAGAKHPAQPFHQTVADVLMSERDYQQSVLRQMNDYYTSGNYGTRSAPFYGIAV